MARTPYATVARLRETLERGGNGHPETDNALPTSWPDPKLTRHLVDASDIIDSRIGRVHTVPISGEVPEIVAGLCVDIAAYRAWLSFMGSKDLTDDDPFVLRYRDAMALLKDIASGDAIIPPSPAEPGPGEPVAFQQYDGHLFGMEDFGLGYCPPGAERPWGGSGW